MLQEGERCLGGSPRGTSQPQSSLLGRGVEPCAGGFGVGGVFQKQETLRPGSCRVRHIHRKGYDVISAVLPGVPCSGRSTGLRSAVWPGPCRHQQPHGLCLRPARTLSRGQSCFEQPHPAKAESVPCDLERAGRTFAHPKANQKSPQLHSVLSFLQHRLKTP